jgi:hypothetical protein
LEKLVVGNANSKKKTPSADACYERVYRAIFSSVARTRSRMESFKLTGSGYLDFKAQKGTGSISPAKEVAKPLRRRRTGTVSAQEPVDSSFVIIFLSLNLSQPSEAYSICLHPPCTSIPCPPLALCARGVDYVHSPARSAALRS